MFNKFSYVSEKITQSTFYSEPFEHIVVDDFLSDEHFNLIINSEQIKFPIFHDLTLLIEHILNSGYQFSPFPGGSPTIKEYIDSTKSNNWKVDKRKMSALGLVFKLRRFDNPLIQELVEYLNSPDFHNCLLEKFSIGRKTSIRTDIQKYLNKFEIPPHPDSVDKCLTYLANINTAESSSIEMYTHLLDFKPERKYIGEFWKYNTEYDRDWLPWNWCDIKKTISKNNSLVMFATSYKSLHAIKCNFDHLKYQRNLIYGNVMYMDINRGRDFPIVPYTEFDMTPLSQDKTNIYRNHIRKILP